MLAMMKRTAGAGVLAASAGVVSAGDVSPPPGPVGPSMKTLAEVEPRIAINAANTPGDENSLFRITEPGSYYLPGNVTGVAGMHGIEIAASNVTIDLMGHTLEGAPGSLDGIATAYLLFRVNIRNGIVYGWSGDGIDLTEGGPLRYAVVEDIHANANSGDGIRVGDMSIVRGCLAYYNTGDGIVATHRATIESCIAENNTDGITTGEGCSITGCSAGDNDELGIFGGSGSSIRGCVASNNGTVGISASTGGTITDSASRNNGDDGFSVGFGASITNSTASDNAGSGIRATVGCTVLGNTCRGNGAAAPDAGIYIWSSDNRVEGNTCTGNERGISSAGSGNIIVRNVCSGNDTNWHIGVGNVCFVVDATNAPGIFGDSGGVSPGSTDPNANYTY